MIYYIIIYSISISVHHTICYSVVYYTILYYSIESSHPSPDTVPGTHTHRHYACNNAFIMDVVDQTHRCFVGDAFPVQVADDCEDHAFKSPVRSCTDLIALEHLLSCALRLCLAAWSDRVPRSSAVSLAHAPPLLHTS